MTSWYLLIIELCFDAILYSKLATKMLMRDMWNVHTGRRFPTLALGYSLERLHGKPGSYYMRPNLHSPANFPEILGVCQRRLHMFCRPRNHPVPRRVVASGWPVVPRPHIWNLCFPFYVWLPGCCIHPILYLKMCPPCGFCPPLRWNPGDGPGSSWKALESVAGVRCWQPPVTGHKVFVFLLRSLCPCRRS